MLVGSDFYLASADAVVRFPYQKGQGRPVRLALDRTGARLVADDVGNAVWRVTAAGWP